MLEQPAWKWLILFYFVVFAIVGGVLFFSLRILDKGDAFSLGQLVLEALVFPAAIIGLVLTLEELRKLREAPDLTLIWGKSSTPDRSRIEVVYEKNGEIRDWLPIVLKNNGSTVATWYLIRFDFPIELVKAYAILETPLPLPYDWRSRAPMSWKHAIGGSENWTFQYNVQNLRVIFMSNGAIASYPGYELPLGEQIIYTLNDADLQKHYQIPFSIFSDKGNPRHGRLSLTLKET